MCSEPTEGDWVIGSWMIGTIWMVVWSLCLQSTRSRTTKLTSCMCVRYATRASGYSELLQAPCLHFCCMSLSKSCFVLYEAYMCMRAVNVVLLLCRGCCSRLSAWPRSVQTCINMSKHLCSGLWQLPGPHWQSSGGKWRPLWICAVHESFNQTPARWGRFVSA